MTTFSGKTQHTCLLTLDREPTTDQSMNTTYDLPSHKFLFWLTVLRELHLVEQALTREGCQSPPASCMAPLVL